MLKRGRIANTCWVMLAAVLPTAPYLSIRFGPKRAYMLTSSPYFQHLLVAWLFQYQYPRVSPAPCSQKKASALVLGVRTKSRTSAISAAIWDKS